MGGNQLFTVIDRIPEMQTIGAGTIQDSVTVELGCQERYCW